MYEFEVLLKNGETTFVYGYSEADFRKPASAQSAKDTQTFLTRSKKFLAGNMWIN